MGKTIERNHQEIPIIITALWMGFVLSISFMEAWLKFRAPGVTLEIGLSIGSLIFFVLNKVELFFAFVLLIDIIYRKRTTKISIWFFIALVILIQQTLYFLPVLAERADSIIAGAVLAPSYFHSYYIVLEALKVTFLATYVLKYYKNKS